MGNTKIEWAEKTWNPITGCTKISPGCANCYAERMSKRLVGRCGYDKDNPFQVTLHVDRLDEPLKWRKPQMVFVCSMGDLFHGDVPDDWIDQVFGAILGCKIFNNVPDHTFLILTKRPERMREYLGTRTPEELLRAWANACPCYTDDPNVSVEDLVYSETCYDWDEHGRNSNGSEYKPWGYIQRLFPLSNVWLGVTAENQEKANERIPILLQIPAAKRFVSVEPMLGSVDLESLELGPNGYGLTFLLNALTGWAHGNIEKSGKPKVHRNDQFGRLDWVICGGETGPGARPMHPDWARSLRDQCVSAGVPFFFKQQGEWGYTPYGNRKGMNPYESIRLNGDLLFRCGKKFAGRNLDGREWNERPEVE